MQNFFSMKSFIFYHSKIFNVSIQFKALGFILYFLLLLSNNVFAQKQTKEYYQSSLKGGTTIGYLSYLPPAYHGNDNKEFPLLIFLHGAGESGNNLDLVARSGPPLLINQGNWPEERPFIVISPQTSSTFANNWAPFMINNVIDHIISKYRIDESRIYITGLSLGGHGSWNYTTEYPDRVAAVVPVCGSGNVKRACEMKDVPVWAFHNEGDKVVHVNGTKNMIKALNECVAEPTPKSVIYPNNGHDAWTKTYNLSAGHDIYTWMLSHTNKRASNPSNKAPVANAGGDKTLTLPNNSITLNGSGTDSDGSIASYQWTKVSGPNASMADANKASLKVSNLSEGTYTFKLTVTDNKGATASAQAKVTVNPAPEPENQAPVANAGGDKTLTLPDNSIALNGNGTDSDGSITSYLWTKVSGPNVTMTDTDKTNLKLSNLLEGTYTFQLTVTDNKGATASAQAKMTVNPEPVNQAPVANAGKDKTLTLPDNSATLEGSGTDSDGSITFYQWTKVSGPDAAMTDTDKANLKLNDLLEGAYVFRLTVTDNRDATASAQVKVTVNPAPEPENEAPVADSGEDKILTLPENSITLDGTGTDSDGSITSYQWAKISGPDVTMTDADKASLKLSNLVAGFYTFRLTVTDNKGETASSQVIVTVYPEAGSENQAPIADAGEDKILTLPDNSITIVGSGSDGDGIITHYQWAMVSGPDVTMADTDKASLKLNNLLEGTYVFRLTVSDDNGATASSDVKVTVEPEPENQIPTVNAGEDKTLTLPTNFISLNGTGEDSDGVIVSYHWSKVSGPEVDMDGTNEATLNLSDLLEGTYTFRLTVTDNRDGTASDQVKVTVNPAPNVSPLANAGNDKTITLPTNTLSLNGSGEDPDGTIAAYTWTKESGPDATMIDADKAVINLSNLLEGNYTFRLTVTDNRGAKASDEVKVTVNPAPNLPPLADAGQDQLVHLPNNSIKLSGKGTDSDGTVTAYQWSKVSGPSASITDAYTPTLSLEDLVAGTYTFRLTVTDNKGAKASDDVKIIVNAPPLANAGRDKTITLPENATYLSGAGSDTDGTIAAYSWTQKSGPKATMKNPDTYLLLLSSLQEGTYVFTLEVTDNRGAKATDDVKLTVLSSPNLPPTVDAGRDRKIQLPNNSLQLVGNATDVDGEIVSYAWTKVAGPAATMAGANKPTLGLSDLQEGLYTFRLTVRDDDGATASDEVRVIVERVVSKIALEFTTTGNSCFGASAGEALVTVIGGEMPYTYYWSNGETTESITNLAAGSYTLTVTDKAGRSAKGTVNIGQPEELRLSIEIANETNRGNDGSLRVNVNGGTPPYTYEWSNGATGATNANLSKAEYTILVRDANGCTIEQTYQVDRFKEYKTVIYPNPNNGRFNLSFDNLETDRYELKIYDAFGAIVFEKSSDITSALHTETLDLSEKGKGIYFIKIIYDGEHEETSRIVIN